MFPLSVHYTTTHYMTHTLHGTHTTWHTHTHTHAHTHTQTHAHTHLISLSWIRRTGPGTNLAEAVVLVAGEITFTMEHSTTPTIELGLYWWRKMASTVPYSWYM